MCSIWFVHIILIIISFSLGIFSDFSEGYVETRHRTHDYHYSNTIWGVYIANTVVPTQVASSLPTGRRRDLQFNATPEQRILEESENPCELREEAFGYVCMCNTTYCDDQGRMPTKLAKGRFVAFTSSKLDFYTGVPVIQALEVLGYLFVFYAEASAIQALKSGGRFTYKRGRLTRRRTTAHTKRWNMPRRYPTLSVTINRSETYQEILGFGGAFTDSAGINIMKMSESVQDSILRSYFSEEGLQYNMGRVPIGGSDFSTRGYSYNDNPSDDLTLTNFTLSEEDFNYKIPLIKRAQGLSSEKLLLTSAVWSPPPWMKTNNNYVGTSFLKPEFYQAYALYHLKFLEKYQENGIEIWSMSTGNEPMSGVFGDVSGINSLGWTPSDQANWIVNNFGPTIKGSANFNETKILFLDDQRPNVLLWLPEMKSAQPEILKYMDGVAVHWYMDFVLPDSVLDDLRNEYPDKLIINTEACLGSVPLQRKVELGSWSRGETYLHYMISDLNHEVNAWIDWNLVLDLAGGPNWVRNNVDAFILVNPEKDEYYKQPMYYAFGHISKFVPRHSFRIKAETDAKEPVPYTAFLRPDGNVAVIVLNNEYSSKKLVINEDDLSIEWYLEPHSITTLVYNPGV